MHLASGFRQRDHSHAGGEAPHRSPKLFSCYARGHEWLRSLDCGTSILARTDLTVARRFLRRAGTFFHLRVPYMLEVL
jgi:hypothetical protein